MIYRPLPFLNQDCSRQWQGAFELFYRFDHRLGRFNPTDLFLKMAQPLIFSEPHGIRSYSREQRKLGKRIALVPTMVRDRCLIFSALDSNTAERSLTHHC